MPAGTNYCIPEGMLGDRLSNMAATDKSDAHRISFSLFNHFLHPNHPLGWVRRLEVFVNERAIPASDMFFVVRGQWVSVEHMPTITDIWWHMREEAVIHIKHPVITSPTCEIRCVFHVSLQVHTDIVDRDDLWPTLEQAISGTLTVGTKELAQ